MGGGIEVNFFGASRCLCFFDGGRILVFALAGGGVRFLIKEENV